MCFLWELGPQVTAEGSLPPEGVGVGQRLRPRGQGTSSAEGGRALGGPESPPTTSEQGGPERGRGRGWVVEQTQLLGTPSEEEGGLQEARGRGPRHGGAVPR